MRLRLRWWREIFFLAALLFSLTALVPLRFALGWLGYADKGLSAREASGSLWLGALSEARFGAVPLGDVATRLRMQPLLVGRARLDLEQADDGLKGAMTLSRHGFGIDDATGTIEGPALAELPPPTLDLADLSFRFADGLCAHAEGLVKARFAGELGSVPLPAGFSGEARCDGPALLLPLVSQSGGERLDVRLFADGRYRIDATLRPGGAPYSSRLEGRF
ncbi:MAG TPA: type II secretion system protein N [Allosphingosinicella sp.]|jgi:general secretion pathway protein N|nr:type II secretion system protein N [Allosphingosinicella sp.]